MKPDLMECERAESLHAEGISGFLSGNGCRYFLLTGDKIAGGTDRTGSARISSVLELRREKGYSGTAILQRKSPYR